MAAPIAASFAITKVDVSTIATSSKLLGYSILIFILLLNNPPLLFRKNLNISSLSVSKVVSCGDVISMKVIGASPSETFFNTIVPGMSQLQSSSSSSSIQYLIDLSSIGTGRMNIFRKDRRVNIWDYRICSFKQIDIVRHGGINYNNQKIFSQAYIFSSITLCKEHHLHYLSIYYFYR